MRLVIIGSGNVANVLGRLFFEAGHQIVQLVGRNRNAVEELAVSIEATPCYDWQQMVGDADIYIMAMNDAALYQLGERVYFKTGIVVHTAGSVPSIILGKLAARYGVLYPLQTMKKGEASGKDVPFLVTGNTDAVIQTISSLAYTVSSSVSVLDDEQRIKMHLAATIVNNFSNHLFALAYDFCQKEGLDFSLLAPLITRTAELAGRGNPALLQTGAAARKDFITMEKHELLLTRYPELGKIYRLMSESLNR